MARQRDALLEAIGAPTFDMAMAWIRGARRYAVEQERELLVRFFTATLSSPLVTEQRNIEDAVDACLRTALAARERLRLQHDAEEPSRGAAGSDS